MFVAVQFIELLQKKPSQIKRSDLVVRAFSTGISGGQRDEEERALTYIDIYPGTDSS